MFNAAFFSSLGKLTGLLIPFFVGNWFRQGEITDTFFYVNTIAIFIYGIFSVSIESVCIPMLGRLKAEGASYDEYLVHTISIIVLFSSIFLLFVSLSDDYFLSRLTGFSDDQRVVIGKMFLCIIPFIVFSAVNSILVSAFYVQNEYKVSSLSSGVRPIFIIALGYLFKGSMGLYSLVMGYSLGEFVRLLILLFLGQKRNYFQMKYEYFVCTKISLSEFLGSYGIQMVGMLLVGLNPLIIKGIASSLGVGAISYLEFGEKLGLLPSAFLGFGIVNVFFSDWSSKFYTVRYKLFLKEFWCTNLILTGVLAIIVIFLFTVLDQIVAFSLPRITLDKALLSKVTILYLISNIPYLLQGNFVKLKFIENRFGFYAAVQFFGSAVYIVSAVLCAKMLGVQGLAIGFLIYNIFLLLVFGLDSMKRTER